MADVHYFDVNIAQKYGVNCAVILQNIYYWIKKNEANGMNYYDGTYWTYNSTKAFKEQFPYLSQRQIETALKKLRDEGIIQTGNYNEQKYDRTLWYAITQKGKCILHTGEMDFTPKGNGFHPDVKPIPNNKPNDKTQIENADKEIDESPKRTRFVPPTLDEVKAYCVERKNNVDAERFINYYSANGWKVGRNTMRDWRAAVRNWEKNGYDKDKKTYGQNGIAIDQDATDEFAGLF